MPQVDSFGLPRAIELRLHIYQDPLPVLEQFGDQRPVAIYIMVMGDSKDHRIRAVAMI